MPPVAAVSQSPRAEEVLSEEQLAEF
eukprot:SAG31_NODE_21716_length_542_cov_1.388262_1_plen_25_part_01